MPRFFTEYSSFRERIEAAINAGDVKLVQLLLGPDYCQVWQYWAVHAMISHNILAIERTSSYELPNIVYTEQKKLLNGQRNALKEGTAKVTNIFPARELLKKLFVIAHDETKKYKETIVNDNKVIDGIHHLFQVPGEDGYRRHYIANDVTRREELSRENSCQDLLPIKNAEDKHGFETALGCIFPALRSINKVLTTEVIGELDLLINIVEKVMDERIWRDEGKLFHVLHYLDQVDLWLHNEGLDTVNAAMENTSERIPENILEYILEFTNNIPGVQSASTTIGTVVNTAVPYFKIISRVTACSWALRFTTELILDLYDKKYDNMNDLDQVEKKIKQVERIIEGLERQINDKEREEINKELLRKENDIKVNVLNKLMDGRPIKKHFVEEMYNKLFKRYINYFLYEGEIFYNDKFKPSNLLRAEIEGYMKQYQSCTEEEKQNARKALKEYLHSKISEGYVNYKEFNDIINKEIGKSDINLDILSVLIANCAYPANFEGTLEKRTSLGTSLTNKNKKVYKYPSKSMNTIIMEVHEMLFDFYDASNTLELISIFPSKKGHFDRSSKDKYLFAEVGDIQFKDKVKEVLAYKSDMEKRQERGRLNRYHYKSFEPLYFIFYDLLGLKSRKSAANYEYRKIDKAMVEFFDLLIYATICCDEGMVHDYIDKIEERICIEKDGDVQGLYRVITGKTWTDWWNQWWHWNNGFNGTKENGSYHIKAFLKNMPPAIEKLMIEEGKQEAGVQINKMIAIEQRADEAKERAEQEKERAEQIKKISKIFTKKALKCNNEKLRDIITDNYDDIIEAVVQCTMNDNVLLSEEILDVIIEEIKSNSEQVIRDGVVSEELIQSSIASFLSQGTSLSNVNVSYGVSTVMGRN